MKAIADLRRMESNPALFKIMYYIVKYVHGCRYWWNFIDHRWEGLKGNGTVFKNETAAMQYNESFFRGIYKIEK